MPHPFARCLAFAALLAGTSCQRSTPSLLALADSEGQFQGMQAGRRCAPVPTGDPDYDQDNRRDYERKQRDWAELQEYLRRSGIPVTPVEQANRDLDRMGDWLVGHPDPARRALYADAYLAAWSRAYQASKQECHVRQVQSAAGYSHVVVKLTPAQARAAEREQKEAQRRAEIRDLIDEELRRQAEQNR